MLCVDDVIPHPDCWSQMWLVVRKEPITEVAYVLAMVMPTTISEAGIVFADLSVVSEKEEFTGVL
jgi:hypothetical protein